MSTVLLPPGFNPIAYHILVSGFENSLNYVADPGILSHWSDG